MSQKKMNYWDQIFTNQVPEAEKTSNEENVLDFSNPVPSQEHERHVREILFSEEGDEMVPMSHSVMEEAVVASELEMVNAVDSADVVTPMNAVIAENNVTEPEVTEIDDAEFLGWHITSKSYARVGFDRFEPMEETEKTESDEPEEVENTTECVLEDVMDADAETCACTGDTECSCSEICEECVDEEEAVADVVTEPIAKEEESNVPILTEDGTLRVTLNRYEHPANGFGFGLLEEEVVESDTSEEDSEQVEFVEKAESDEEIFAEEVADETEEGEEIVSEVPAGLDSWGSLAFELGLPVTLPETGVENVEKVAEKALKTPKLEKCEKAEKAEKSDKADGCVKVEKGEKSASKGSRKNKAESVEKVPVILDDDDFITPENVYEMSDRVGEKVEKGARQERAERGEREERRSRRERGHRNRWEESGDEPVEMMSAPVMPSEPEEVVVEEMPPRSRRRRRGNAPAETVVNEEKSATISEIMAGVMASKMNSELSERPSRKSRGMRMEREMREEEVEMEMPRRSRRGRRNMMEMEEEVIERDFCMCHDEESPARPSAFVAEDMDEDEMDMPNGARSRRRRRSQREKMERARVRAQEMPSVCDEEEDEDEMENFSVRKRSRRDSRNGFQGRVSREMEDDELEAWSAQEVDETEEDDDYDMPRSRRQRRSRRSGREEFRESGRGYKDENDRYGRPEDDDEEHVFTEVGNEDDDEEDDEWETDFSQHEVPSWRYTIDFIVNTNLKARKREPSSMAGNMNRGNNNKRPRRK